MREFLANGLLVGIESQTSAQSRCDIVSLALHHSPQNPHAVMAVDGDAVTNCQPSISGQLAEHLTVSSSAHWLHYALVAKSLSEKEKWDVLAKVLALGPKEPMGLYVANSWGLKNWYTLLPEQQATALQAIRQRAEWDSRQAINEAFQMKRHILWCRLVESDLCD